MKVNLWCPSYWCFEDAGMGMQHDTNAEIQEGLKKKVTRLSLGAGALCL